MIARGVASSAVAIALLASLPACRTMGNLWHGGYSVPKDRATVVGSSAPSLRYLYQRKPPNGNFGVTAESVLVFEADDILIEIPSNAIVSLEFGRQGYHEFDRPYLLRRALRLPSERLHDLLTITYRDQDGPEQVLIFWLGEGIAWTTLNLLAQETGQEIKVDRIGACTQYKTPDECGDGTPRTLAGLKRLFLDVTVDPEGDERSRERILSEIEKAGFDLEIVDSEDDAQVVLRFHSYSPLWQQQIGPRPALGTGEIYLVQGDRLRELVAFEDWEQVWGRPRATNFGRFFVREYKRANGMR